jgi:hypothetical protein
MFTFAVANLVINCRLRSDVTRVRGNHADIWVNSVA